MWNYKLLLFSQGLVISALAIHVGTCLCPDACLCSAKSTMEQDVASQGAIHWEQNGKLLSFSSEGEEKSFVAEKKGKNIACV